MEEENIIEAYSRAYICGGYCFGDTKGKNEQNRKILGKYIKGWNVPTRNAAGKIRKRIKEGLRTGEIDISDEMGIWTPSFIRGVKDSGGLTGNSWNWYFLHKKWHEELYMDLLEIKMPRKISKEYKKGDIMVSGRCFFEYVGKTDNLQYMAGLFSGSRIVEDGGENWHYMKFRRRGGGILSIEERVKGFFTDMYIPFKEYKEGIIVSPFYGALAYSYMPINSASRQISIEKGGDGVMIGLVYWDMIRKTNEKIAPTSKNILPYSYSYSNYFKKGIIKKGLDIRKMGVEMGILGIRDEIRELLMEWKRYGSFEGEE